MSECGYQEVLKVWPSHQQMNYWGGLFKVSPFLFLYWRPGVQVTQKSAIWTTAHPTFMRVTGLFMLS